MTKITATGFPIPFACQKLTCISIVSICSIPFRKVASSRQVYDSILNFFGQRSQDTSIKFPLHKESECATN